MGGAAPGRGLCNDYTSQFAPFARFALAVDSRGAYAACSPLRRYRETGKEPHAYLVYLYIHRAKA